MSATATFTREIVPVIRHCEDGGFHWLHIHAVNGWDDAKHHHKKILEFEGREYGWSCWNSDRMESVFRSPAWPNARWVHESKPEPTLEQLAEVFA